MCTLPKRSQKDVSTSKQGPSLQRPHQKVHSELPSHPNCCWTSLGMPRLHAKNCQQNATFATNPGHNIVKVNDKAGYDTFPPEVSAFIKREGRVSSKVFGIMKDFAQFKIDLQDAPKPGYVEAFLTHVYSNCGNMRNCSDLPRILTMYQAQKTVLFGVHEEVIIRFEKLFVFPQKHW